MRARILVLAAVAVWLCGVSFVPDVHARSHNYQLIAPDIPDNPGPPGDSDPWVPDEGPPPRAFTPGAVKAVEADVSATDARVNVWMLRVLRVLRLFPIGGLVR